MVRKARDRRIRRQSSRVVIHEVDLFAYRGEFVAAHRVRVTAWNPRPLVYQRFQRVVLSDWRD